MRKRLTWIFILIMGLLGINSCSGKKQIPKRKSDKGSYHSTFYGVQKLVKKEFITSTIAPRLFSVKTTISKVQRKGIKYFHFKEEYIVKIYFSKIFNYFYENGYKTQGLEEEKVIEVYDTYKVEDILKKSMSYKLDKGKCLDNFTKNNTRTCGHLFRSLNVIQSLKASHFYTENRLFKRQSNNKITFSQILEEIYPVIAGANVFVSYDLKNRRIQQISSKEHKRTQKIYFQLTSFIVIKKTGKIIIYEVPFKVFKRYERAYLNYHNRIEGERWELTKFQKKYLKISFSALFKNKKKRVIVWERGIGYKVLK